MPSQTTILILEDNEERIASFRKAVAALGADFDLKIWRDAHSMITECEAFFPTAALISLDHDLNSQPGATSDPGTGLDVAKFLAGCRPACPVIIHSSNTDRVYSMYNEFRFADWIAERVGPIGSDWIETLWLKKAREILTVHANTWPANLPANHEIRMRRALLSLDGLSVGDGFGECFFTADDIINRRVEERTPPPRPWIVTDDTIMALSIVRVLKHYGCINQDALAKAFADEHAREPGRGYGGMARIILQQIEHGIPWKRASRAAFNGEGSCGNGGAMRSAPIGAYFAEDYDRVAYEAMMSAEVTHSHPDGKTGAAAVALAAAWMIRQGKSTVGGGHSLIEFVLERIPKTETYYRLEKALEIPLSSHPRNAAFTLGNGSRVIASDTVPFCLWCAARHAGNYTNALWATVSGLGDRDTTCAIVGGIVALSAGRDNIPEQWIKSREPILI
jgi:ADP-ribosylglycohydrolase